ncbi:MAG: hypothetical protein ACREBH_03185 [Candidatus Micrarchaeaceae archaeon]
MHHINSINKIWGGRFKVQFVKSIGKVLESSTKYMKVYLTMYGMPIQDKTYMLRTYRNILLIVTMNSDSGKINRISDFNISVSSQPHSSTAAIAIFLHEFYNGRELAMHFENAKKKVVPSERGNTIKETG